ncbi:hypothetical protein BGZ95_004525, partial [Linnemannia exigua]
SKMKGIAFNDATLWVDSPAITQERHGCSVHLYSRHDADSLKVKVQISNNSAEAQKFALYPFLKDIDYGIIQPGAAFSIEGFYGHRSFTGTGGIGKAVELRVSKAERDPSKDCLPDLVLASAVSYNNLKNNSS